MIAKSTPITRGLKQLENELRAAQSAFDTAVHEVRSELEDPRIAAEPERVTRCECA